MKKILLTLLCTLLPLLVWAQENEPYAVLSDNNTVLTFYYDSHKAERNGLNVGPFSWSNAPSWYAEREAITSAVFDASFAASTTLTSTAYWFYGCSNLSTISGMKNLKTDNVTNMGYMFLDCSGLTSLDLSSFKTDNVTDMRSMFSGCSGLTSLDLSSFKTDNVTDMSSMFRECSGLTSLDLSSFKTDSVTFMGSMFSGCSGLASLDVSGFKTDNVTYMSSMFFGCSGLTSLDLSGFKTDNVTSMGEMFRNCRGLTSLDVSGFKTDNVTNMGYMFIGCSGLTGLDLSSFNTSNVTSMFGMFRDCSGLSGLDLGNFNISSVTNMNSMFYGCSGLTSLDLSNFNTSSVTDMEVMFWGCSGLTTIYVGEGWNTATVTKGGWMFTHCSNLVGGMGTKYQDDHADYTYARIDQGPNSDAPGYFTRSGDAPWIEPEAYAVLSDSDTVLTFYYDNHKAERNGMGVGPFYFDYQSNSPNQSWYAQRETITTVVFDVSFADCTILSSTSWWFFECRNLTAILGMENLKTDNVAHMGYMFAYCSGLTSLDLSNLNTVNVTNMMGLFRGCSGLTNLDLTSFNTVNVTDMGDMFCDCSGLMSLDLSGFNTSNVTYMGQMFSSCRSLMSLDLSSFNTSNVTNMGKMFQDCRSLTNLDLSNFNTSNLKGMGFMFSGCSSLTSLDLSSFNTSNVTSMVDMFGGCSALTSLDLSSFNTSNVMGMSYMFSGCSNLTTIYVGEGWTTANVTESAEMFSGCPNLVGGKGTKYDADHVDYTYARIDQGPDSDAPGYFTRSGDIPWGEKSTFDGRVLTVRGSGSIDAALAQVGGFEQVDKTITAIVWEADVPYSSEAVFSNPNLLFYANDATKGQAINNLIYNGVAESITLTDEGEGNTDFYCPQSFTARSITYKRSFQQQTEIGVSRGWETIALPFTVQRISRVRSDEGLDRITPFGSSESTRHFWLRRLTANGLQGVQTIEANTPYIIAMPNSEEYAAEYNLAGDIVFTAENATVAVTEPVSDRSTDYELTANFERMAAQDSIYVLNVGTPRYGYPEGSLFEAAYRDLQPFRAYTRHINSGRPAPPYFALGNLGGTTTTGISSVSDTFATDTWYDIQGRKLQGWPTKKGVYIQNGRKVIVK